MKTLGELIGPDRLKSLAKHPKHKIMDEMLKRINLDRRDTKWKPFTMRALAIKTSHLSLEDLDFLLKRMSQSPNPGKVFFGSLKVR